MKSLLTPRQVAQSLGVSESSLKRWCDRGELPFKRTAGGHRRIPARAVVRFLRENQREVIRPEILGLPVGTIRQDAVLHDSIQVLVRALVRGDAVNSRRIVLALFLAGNSVASICDELLTPALSLIGDRWQCGDVEVFEEHRAVEIVVRLLHELRLNLEMADCAPAMTAIGGSVEGDSYGLPTRMVELAFLETGWNATSLGTSLPFDTLLRAVRQSDPRVVWFSISVIEGEESFVAALNAFCREVPSTTAVVLGGRDLTSELRDQIRNATCFANLQQLSDYAGNRKAATERKRA